jgi:hypothetical protein
VDPGGGGAGTGQGTGTGTGTGRGGLSAGVRLGRTLRGLGVHQTYNEQCVVHCILVVVHPLGTLTRLMPPPPCTPSLAMAGVAWLLAGALFGYE